MTTFLASLLCALRVFFNTLQAQAFGEPTTLHSAPGLNFSHLFWRQLERHEDRVENFEQIGEFGCEFLRRSFARFFDELLEQGATKIALIHHFDLCPLATRGDDFGDTISNHFVVVHESFWSIQKLVTAQSLPRQKPTWVSKPEEPTVASAKWTKLGASR